MFQRKESEALFFLILGVRYAIIIVFHAGGCGLIYETWD